MRKSSPIEMLELFELRPTFENAARFAVICAREPGERFEVARILALVVMRRAPLPGWKGLLFKAAISFAVRFVFTRETRAAIAKAESSIA